MDKETQVKLADLYKKFAEHLPERISTIELSWEKLKSEPWQADSCLIFQQLVHALSGSAGIYGFKDLSTQLQQLETLLKHAVSVEPTAEDSKVIDEIVSTLQGLVKPCPSHPTE